MRGKRAAIIAVAAAVALFTGGTAARCAAMVAAGDGAAGQQENAQERGEDGQGLPDGEAAPPGAQDLLARLGSAPWSDATGSIVLEFGDGTFTERRAGESEGVITEFSIESVDARPNGTTAVIEAGGEHVALSLSLPSEGAAAVESPAFKLAPSYRGSAEAAYEVNGVTEEAAALAVAAPEEVEAAVAEHCRANLPAATRAEFTGLASVDFDAGTATLYFASEFAPGVEVAAVCDGKGGIACSTMAGGPS